jgi:hypothetical protein
MKRIEIKMRYYQFPQEIKVILDERDAKNVLYAFRTMDNVFLASPLGAPQMSRAEFPLSLNICGKRYDCDLIVSRSVFTRDTGLDLGKFYLRIKHELGERPTEPVERTYLEKRMKQKGWYDK